MFKDFSTDQGSINLQAVQTQTLQVTDGRIEVSHDSFIRDADMSRDGMDLVLKGPDGTIVIEGYFAAVPAPLITSQNGLTLSPELVDAFTQSPLEYADASQSGIASDASPVGAINELSGEAHVTRLDGTIEAVQVGTPIFQGDIVETTEDGALNIVFIDETSMAVSEDARLSIDEYVFDPSTAEGSTNFSILKGVFVFTSGMIGREDPDDVQIETPMGSIGIRGTIIAGDVTGGEITVVEGAIVLTDFSGNEMTLANQFETARFNPNGGGIENVGQLSANDVMGKFSSISGVSADLFSSIGDAANDAQKTEGAPDGEGEQPQDAQGNDDNGEAEPNEDPNAAQDTQGQSDEQQQAAEEASEGEAGEAGDDGENSEGEAQAGQQQEAQDTENADSDTPASDADGGESTINNNFANGQANGLESTSQTNSNAENAKANANSNRAANNKLSANNSDAADVSDTVDKNDTLDTTETLTPPDVLEDARAEDSTDELTSFSWTTTAGISELASTYQRVASFDLSSDIATNLSYTIISGNDDNLYSISASGNIFFNGSGTLDFETASSQDLTIAIRGPESGLLSVETVTLDIIDINETPVLTPTALSDVSYSVGDSAVNLFDIQAGDLDDGDSGLQNYQSFSINVGNVNDGSDETIDFESDSVSLAMLDTATTIALQGKDFDVTVSEPSVNLFQISVTAVDSGDYLTQAELEGILNSVTYSNTSSTPTYGDRYIDINTIQDTGGIDNGGTDTTTFGTSLRATINVTGSLDLNAISSSEGFDVTDDLGLSFADNFFGGQDIDQNGFDDLIIGRGNELFQLAGQDGGYLDMSIASPTGNAQLIDNNGVISGSDTVDIFKVSDLNGDGNADYIMANPNDNGTGTVDVITGGDEIGVYDPSAGSESVVASHSYFNASAYVLSILSNGDRFLSSLNSDDTINTPTANITTNTVIGTITDVYFDTSSHDAIVVSDNGSDGSIGIYDSVGVKINLVTADSALAGAQKVVVVYDSSGGHNDAYVITSTNSIVKFDDIDGSMSGASVTDLATLNSNLYSNVYVGADPGAITEITDIISDGSTLYLVAERASGNSSLLKIDGSGNISNVTDLIYDTTNGVNTPGADDITNIITATVSGTDVIALVENSTTGIVKLVSAPLSNIGAASDLIGTSGAVSYAIDSDLFPSILGAEQIIYDGTSKIAVLSSSGVISEFDVTSPSSPSLTGIVSDMFYTGAQISYGQNGNLLVSVNEEIITVEMPNISYGEPIAATTGDLAGEDVALAGDFDNDGLQDFIYSSPGEGTSTEGSVHIVLGDDMDGGSIVLKDITITNIDHNGTYEIPVLGGGDINGDGVSDIAIFEEATNSLHFFLGYSIAAASSFDINDSTYKNGTNGKGFTIDISSSSEEILSGNFIGDFDGDGYDDFAVALKTPGSSDYDVDIYVFFGQDITAGSTLNYSDLTDSTNSFHMTYTMPTSGGYDGDSFNVQIASAGDLNGDGLDDLALGLFDIDNNISFNSDGIGNIDDDSDGSAIIVYGQGGADQTGSAIGSSAADQILHGTSGDDSIAQTDVTHTNLTIKTGAGDDTIKLIADIPEQHHIDGGAGYDVLEIYNTDINFGFVNELDMQRIEEIYISGAGNNTLDIEIDTLRHLMNNSDTNELFISTDGGGIDYLIIDHDYRGEAVASYGTNGSTTTADIESALEAVFGSENVDHSSDISGYETFTIGDFDLNIDTNLIANTTSSDTPSPY